VVTVETSDYQKPTQLQRDIIICVQSAHFTVTRFVFFHISFPLPHHVDHSSANDFDASVFGLIHRAPNVFSTTVFWLRMTSSLTFFSRTIFFPSPAVIFTVCFVRTQYTCIMRGELRKPDNGRRLKTLYTLRSMSATPRTPSPVVNSSRNARVPAVVYLCGESRTRHRISDRSRKSYNLGRRNGGDRTVLYR